MSGFDHDVECIPDGEWYACLDGRRYGPCEDENCGGVCEFLGDCNCACHDDGTKEDTTDATS